ALPEYKERFAELSTFPVKAAAAYLRVENKLNRMMTKSDWQVMHGINSDPEVFEHYHSLIPYRLPAVV
ncbi:MAG: hypothetical protein V4543_17010, partial [Bacteroidota bacterium]